MSINSFKHRNFFVIDETLTVLYAFKVLHLLNKIRLGRREEGEGEGGILNRLGRREEEEEGGRGDII